MPAVDEFKSLNRLDQVVLGTGVLGFILSLFHVFVVSVSGPGSALIGGSLGSRGAATAWHNWGVIGMLFVLAATAVVAVRLFAPASMPKLPVGVNLLALALSGLGFLCIVIAWFHNSSSASFSGVKISVHLGIFGYLLVLDVLAQAVAAFLLFKSSGEVMPDFKAMQASRPAGSVPPPPGYSTPPPAATYPPATPSGDFTLDDTQPPTASH